MMSFQEKVWEEEGGRRTSRTQNVDLEYPEFCRVTVERVVDGTVRKFTAREYWMENYATKGSKNTEPNAMWRRRPFAQLAKCAEAQALRKAFPEFGAQPTADELEGKTTLDDDDRTIDMPALTKAPVEAPKSKSEQRAAAAAAATDVDPIKTTAERPAPGTSTEKTTPVEGKPISDSVRRVLITKMENAAVSEADIKKKFGFDLTGVTTANYNDVVSWLADPTQ